MTPTVYKIEFPDGSCYIGSTVDFSSRRKTHLRHGARGEAVNPRLAAEFRKYPVCGIYPVAECKTREALHIVEQQVMFDEQPSLNMHISPTPIPAAWDGNAKPLGAFPSVRAASAALGVPYPRMKRLARGSNFDLPKILEKISEKDAAKDRNKTTGTHPLDPRKNQALINLGSGWERRSGLMASAGVSAAMYKARRKRGWSAEDALTTPRRPVLVGPPKPRMLNEYKEMSPGVPVYLYKSRLRSGWTEAQALGLEARNVEPKVRRRNITLAGVTKTLDQWCVDLGIRKSVVSSRLGLGWTEPQALGVEDVPRIAARAARQRAEAERKQRKRVTLGPLSGSLTSVAAALETTPYGLSKLLKRGYGTIDFDPEADEVCWYLMDLSPVRYSIDEFYDA